LEAARLPADAERLATAIVAAQVRALFADAHGEYVPDERVAMLRPSHGRWLDATLRHLENHGLYAADAQTQRGRFFEGEPLEALWTRWDDAMRTWSADANHRAYLALVEACLRRLPEVLSGAVPATDVMFPESSMHLVEGIYKHNLIADHFNLVLCESLRAECAAKAERGERGLRLLEIGAGTGGTTAGLLPMLRGFGDLVEEYCYTDLSKAFLLHAQETYKPEFPALRTAIFNVGKPLSLQSIEGNRYDAVIATNVLHATSNMRETVRNAKALLKRGGMLLVNELSAWAWYTHFTFGLLDGWWLYEDEKLRLSGSPCLSPAQWESLLKAERFLDIRFPAHADHGLGQLTLAARSDGVVRQRLVTPAAPAKAAPPRRSAPAAALSSPTALERPSAKTASLPAMKSLSTSTSALVETDDAALRAACTLLFREMIAGALRMDVGEIETHRPLEQYGLDSILVVQLTTHFRKLFPGTRSTLFFEVQSIDGLVAHFLEHDRETAAHAASLHAATLEMAPATTTSAPATTSLSTSASALVETDDAALRAACALLFREMIAGALRMDVSEIETHKPLEQYGLDSILVVQLTTHFRKLFPGTRSTLFFEVQSIDGLVAHFLEHDRETAAHAASVHAATVQAATAPPSASAALPSARVPAMSVPAARARGKALDRFGRRLAPRSDETPALPVRPAADATPSVDASAERAVRFDVAIVGVSGRYPQAPDLESFWDNLASGRSCASEVPADRWRWQDYHDAEKGKAGKSYTRWGGFLDDIDKFDPLFFRIAPKEAKKIDPQERLFLETSYHAIEDSGYTPATLAPGGKVGVFVGVMNSRYTVQPLFYSIANRVSFLFDFSGPSFAVDSACSSSLTAIHLALDSLYSGMCEAAIAGAVSLILDPQHMVELSALGMLSEGAQCRSFGRNADGFVDAEGVGAVVLKSLAHALRDGDTIHAVIKSSALNTGGRTHGYTVPNPAAQAEVVSAALARADIDSADVSYIEAHGTGTALGDPIEVAGLTRAFRSNRRAADRALGPHCAIGSLKSNIGHCESAAGIAALTKVLLQLRHRQLVPTLHADEVNEEIDFSVTPFRLQRESAAWRRQVVGEGAAAREIPRIAGISSFGAGGANAHLVVQEAPAPARMHAWDGRACLLPLSARTSDQLQQKIRQLLAFVQRSGAGVDLPSLAYTLQVGREAMDERILLIAASLDDLQRQLQALSDDGRTDEASSPGAGTHEARTAPRTYRGSVRKSREFLAACRADADFARRCEAWIAQRDDARIAEHWVKGVDIAWAGLYAGALPGRIPLPAYPFARERHWLAPQRTAGQGQGQAVAAKHPLLQRNTSTLRSPGFSVALTGDERFLDIDSAGQRRVPALLCLEMARAAIAETCPDDVAARGLRCEDIALDDTLRIDAACELHIALLPETDDALRFEIFSARDGIEQVHAQGRARFAAAGADSATADMAAADVATLAARLSRGLAADAFHARFAALGLTDNADRRVVQRIAHTARELVLEYAASTEPSTPGTWGLPPELLAAVMQGAAWLRGELAPLPSAPLDWQIHSIDAVRWFGPCGTQGYLVLRCDDSASVDADASRWDVACFDALGAPVLEMRGLRLACVPGEQGTVSQGSTPYGANSIAAASASATVAPAPVLASAPTISEQHAAEQHAAVQPAAEQPATAEARAPAPVSPETGRRIAFLRASASVVRAPAAIEKPMVSLSAIDAPSAAVTGLTRPTVTLPRPQHDGGAEPAQACVDLRALGDGVYALTVAQHAPTAAVVDQLLQALEDVQDRADAKVLLVADGGTGFLPGDVASLDAAIDAGLYGALSGFPLPTIAVMQGDAGAAGFLLGALCDFMVCARESRYAFSEAVHGLHPTLAEAALLAARFGRARANDLLYISGGQDGRALWDKGWTFPVVAREQVMPAALALAADMAAKPRESLRLLKQRMAEALAPLVERLGSEPRPPREPEPTVEPESQPAGEPHAALPGIAIEMLSDDTVASVRLCAGDAALPVMLGRLRETLDALATRGHAAVVLRSDVAGFLPGLPLHSDEADAPQGQALALAAFAALQASLSAFPAPVVVAFEHDADGIGWLLGLSADACVHGDRGQCSADALWQHPALLRQAMPRFAHRLGDNLSRHSLFGATAVDSDALASSAGIVARDGAAVLSTALALAETSPLRSPALLRQWRSLGRTASADGDSDGNSDAGADSRAPAASSAGDSAASPLPQCSAIDIEVRDNGVIVVRMVDREAKNMYSPELIHGLEAVFAHIDASDAYRAVVLTGYDTYFACGGTRESLLAIQQGTAKFTDAKVYQLPMSCKLPVIAAMQGHAIGGGWTLGMFADLCLFSAESRYISPYMQYGFTPGAGSTLIFPARLGLDLARETLFTAAEYTGSELRAKGLPHGCCPRGDILPRALALADAIASRDAGDVRALKRYFSAPLLDAVEATYVRELAMHDRSFVGQGHALQGVMQHFLSDAGPAAPAAQAAAAAAPSVDAPLAQTAAPAASQDTPQDIADFLKTLLASELQMDVGDVDEDTQFVDLGLDSITGVTWIRKINSEYGTRIEATKVYSHPTLRQFRDFVVERVALLGTARTQVVANAAKPVLHAAEPPAAAPASSSTALPMPMPTTTVPTSPVATELVATNAAAAAEADLSVALRQLLAQELHMPEEEIDEHRQFVDLGLDSITGVTWVRRINTAYGTRIEATKVYSHPTLAEFARFLAGLLPARPVQPSPLQPQPSSAPAVQIDAKLADARLLAARARAAAPSARTLTSWRGKAARRTTGDAIAIIGMAGQFPRAGDLDAFWRNIAGGKDCIDTVPPQRFDIERYFSDDISIPGTTNSRWMGVLDDCDAFDPLFFNISPTEAESMDPQQRLMLQNCWHAIENAAIDPRSLSGSRCGVFVGCGATDYHQRSREHQLSTQGFTGAAMSILAARIAYFLNLQGPCLSIDTACSSSLVAIANACDSLVADNCDLALAGGVAVMAGPTMHVKTAQSGMLSVDGRCFAFDHRANGFVPSEGVGALMLKRLADAERDGDMVHAVIRGWGVNQDGKTNGITAPNPVSQTRLMRAVYDRFGIDPEDIQLIEAHGTGTKLGDPIEVEGLTQAFRHYTVKTGYCALGSVKGNIGHSLYAAGIAGALKLVLALKHRQLPPAASFERLNPHIDLSDSPFVVNTALKPWPENAKGGRSAVVSSFGFSGTNAHLVLEAAPTRDARPAVGHDAISAQPALIPLSAKTPEQLRQRAQSLADALAGRLAARIADDDAQATPSLHDIAYTLQLGREAMEERCALVAHSLVELEARLRAFAAELLPTERLPAGMHVGSSLSRAGKLAFIGQDAELKAVLIDTCLRDGKLDKLAELWVDGVDLPWAKLYPAEAGRGPRRVELPLYPFARERYWLEDETAAVAQRIEGAAAAIHPLLHVNASTLRQQRYRSTFDGSESFLRDHRVRFREGRVEHVLPGVAYLEMAAAAIADALPDAFAEAESHSSGPHGRLTLRDVVWWRPIVVDGPMAVEIELGIEDDGVIAFEIASGSGDGRVLHCQGEARFVDAAGERMADAGLLASAQRGERWSDDEIYAAFARMGLHYGPAHRGIRAISRVGGKLVADVALPAIAGDAYRMPPGIMDSALQACIGFLPSLQALPQAPSVPFALRSLTLHAPCPSEVVVVLTPAAGTLDGSGGHAAVESCDVSIFGTDGALCVDIRGFGWRAVDGARGFDGGGMLDRTGLPDDASMLNEARMADATLMYDETSMHEASDETEMFDETFYRELLESISRKDVSAEDALELGLPS
jgi:acyl transferase domain-containing protein/enoyl-CoA hydratase/carnithine racemase/aryl carrier-like protein